MSELSQNVEIVESRLRIMTWNIWWRFGPWEQREPAILQSIADLDPDIIALQEVWGDNATNFAEKVADNPARKKPEPKRKQENDAPVVGLGDHVPAF